LAQPAADQFLVTIPIQNLYYLFCYAWARFPEGALADVGIEACPDLPNLFARVLVNGVNKLIRRGLDRGYVGVTEETRSPRGRLLIDRIAKEQTLRRGSVFCQFDELQHDVLHNQILKATALALAREENIVPALSHELRMIARRLVGITEIPITADVFGRVQLFRNNRQYALLMRLCEFVFRSRLPCPDGKTSRFADILKDEEKMSRVFEEFLRNFYFYEQNRFTVSSENMYWNARSYSAGGMSLIPIMKTDVTLRCPSKIIVMDAKFYAEPFPRSYGVRKLRPAHLYQLFAYLKHASQSSPSTPVEGALIYAAAEEGFLEHYQIEGHAVTIAAIDLMKPWPLIHSELLKLVADSIPLELPAN
jgi:5-methylcytosine-specific restriction enzyme subunit McrC